MKSIKMTIIAFMILLIFSGCSRGAVIDNSEEKKIAIAEQYGLAYAPLQIIKEMGILEKNLPGIQVEWKQLGNTAAIREAMLAGEIDAGFMAIPPFLIGWDKGMQWKIASGLSISPTGLISNNDRIQSIKDFTLNDRIALPQPGSIQHILLSMACEKEFGDPGKLDGNLVTLAHPDGMNALLVGKEIKAHFTSPPYLFKELQREGMHLILDGNDAMGSKFSFIVGVTTEKFHDENEDVYEVFVKSIDEAAEFIAESPRQAAEMLTDIYQIPVDELLDYLTWEGTEYTTKVYGLNKFVEFMNENGYINKTPKNRNEILWEEVQYEN